MNTFKHYKPIMAALIAISATAPSIPLLAATLIQGDADAGRPVIATEQPSPPGTGPNQGDTLRAQMQASPGARMTLLTGATIHDSFGTSLIARELPAAPGTGPNSGDLARAEMQTDPTAFASLGTRYAVRAGAGSVASMDVNNADLHGRGGWNPALVELQATPQSFAVEHTYGKATRSRTGDDISGEALTV